MSELPDPIADLVQRREQARAAKDYPLADRLRDEIRAQGWIVRDAADGVTVVPAPPYETVDARNVRNSLEEPPTERLSLHVLYEGYPDDLRRFLDAFDATCPAAGVEVIVVDNAHPDGEVVEAMVRQHPVARALHLESPVGWAAARNAGLKTSVGAVVALVDLSIEPTGDLVTPLLAAFDDPSVGLAGPFGLVTADMREFAADPGPEVDAIEGYLLATRRELLSQGLIREKFRWYRNADIDLSFQVRDAGTRAVVVDLPVDKHVHRGWEQVPASERPGLSQRNHSIFYGRWKDRMDLLTRA